MKTRDLQYINRLRKLAGLKESAPVEYYGMSKQQQALADIGRLLMDRSEMEKDDELSNAMGELGSGLVDGSISDQSALLSFVQKVGPVSANLAAKVTSVFQDYQAGDRADLRHVDDNLKKSKKRGSVTDEPVDQQDRYADDYGDDQEVPELDPDDDDFQESWDIEIHEEEHDPSEDQDQDQDQDQEDLDESTDEDQDEDQEQDDEVLESPDDFSWLRRMAGI